MVKYQAVEEKHHHPDVGTYTAWGIRGWHDSDGKGPASAYIPDVFLRKKDAEQFAALCTRLNVAICHLSDVVEDYLAK